jgi:4-alpha-glucanotransferase
MRFKTKKQLEEETKEFHHFCQKTIEDLKSKIAFNSIKDKAEKFIKQHPKKS